MMIAPADFEPLDDGGVVRRHEVFEDPRRGGRRQPARAEVVFERDRDAVQRPEQRRPRPVRRRAARARSSALLGRNRVKRVQLAVDVARCDRDARRHTSLARELACAQSARRSSAAVRSVGAHPNTRGTLNRPACVAASGALASASSRGSVVQGSSARSIG